MGQRIVIQYSVEDNELKFEVERLLSAALHRLNSIESAPPPPSTVLTVGTVKEIELLREELARIDIMFEDIAVIVGGYIKHKHATFVEEFPAAPDISEELYRVEQKLSNLKHNIGPTNNDIPTQRSET
jgi:hypothetical protein